MRVYRFLAGAAFVGGAVLGAYSLVHATAPGTVTGFNISADPRSFAGSCPAKIGWKATIHVSNPPVLVEYRWERSDGAKGATRKLTITDKTADVTETWQLGGSGSHMTVWQKVHVLSPADKSSGTAPVRIACS
ncbi:MAG: hypothetical protein ACREPM_24345 [Gemmatimonadaceae bacterium]